MVELVDIPEVVFVVMLRLGEHLSAGELERRLRLAVAIEVLGRRDNAGLSLDGEVDEAVEYAVRSIAMYGRGSPVSTCDGRLGWHYQILVHAGEGFSPKRLVARVRREFGIEAEEGLFFCSEPQGNVAAKGWLSWWEHWLCRESWGTDAFGDAERLFGRLEERYDYVSDLDLEDEGLGPM